MKKEKLGIWKSGNVLCSKTLQCIGVRKAESAERMSRMYMCLSRMAHRPHCENDCAQQHSNISEYDVQNGFGIVPSVPDGTVQNKGRWCPEWV